MTREEAVKTYMVATPRQALALVEEGYYSLEFIERIVREGAEDAIDALAALGVLKLDE